VPNPEPTTVKSLPRLCEVCGLHAVSSPKALTRLDCRAAENRSPYLKPQDRPVNWRRNRA